MRTASFLLLAALVGCSRGDQAAKQRLFAPADDGARKAFDPEHPEAALALTADQVAERLGSFEWAAAVEWSVSRGSGAPLHVTEQHKLRQHSTGEFEVRADVDPGQGPSALQGKEVVYTGGMTYARALPAPFRQRPTDRGHDARRFREDSFGLLRAVAGMIGPALRLEPAGSQTVLGRQALRYRFSVAQAAAKPSTPAPAGYQAGDADTAMRQGFLRGSTPRAAEGELDVDAQTGAPLQARLTATFDAGDVGPAAEAADPAKAGGRPAVSVTVTVSAQMQGFGGEVKAIAAPENALPDERKPAGPSTALEAAGLKKRGEGESAEPGAPAPAPGAAGAKQGGEAAPGEAPEPPDDAE